MNNENVKKTSTSNTQKISHSRKDTFKIYQDSLKAIELNSINLDTLEYSIFYDTEHSYNIIYHKKGLNNGNRFGLSIYSINENTLRVKLIKSIENVLVYCDSIDVKNIKFSPAMFHTIYKDFNNDNQKDLYMILAQSMGVAYDYGLLITISTSTEKINLISNSYDIPNLKAENGKITSVTYNHPGHEIKEYTQTNEYVITQNQLELVNSTKRHKK